MSSTTTTMSTAVHVAQNGATLTVTVAGSHICSSSVETAALTAAPQLLRRPLDRGRLLGGRGGVHVDGARSPPGGRRRAAPARALAAGGRLTSGEGRSVDMAHPLGVGG
ncbi:MAG: hypothetical protein U0470_00425 [Anaerolineae bacterium]